MKRGTSNSTTRSTRQSSRKKWSKIEPAVEGLNIYPSGNHLYFQGYKKGNTTYKITVDCGLTDAFGQTLGQPAVATIKVGPAPQNFYAQGGSMVGARSDVEADLLDLFDQSRSTPACECTASRRRTGTSSCSITAGCNYDDNQRPAIPGTADLGQGRVDQERSRTKWSKPASTLRRPSTAVFGNVILDIEPTVRRDKYDRSRIFTWVQATQIGLDAFVDNQELVGFATELGRASR